MNVCRKGIVLASIFAFFSLFICSACQNTPNDDKVVSKNVNQFEKKLLKTNEDEGIVFPSIWKEDIKTGKMSINVDVKLDIPKTNKYPVIKVKPKVLTQQSINDLIGYFAQDSKLYKLPVTLTKADYEKELVELRRSQVYSENDIAEFEEKIKNAPDYAEKEYTTSELDFYLDDNGKAIESYGKGYLNVGVQRQNENDDDIIKVKNYLDGKVFSTRFSFFGGWDYVTETFFNQNKESILEGQKYSGVRQTDFIKCFSKISITEDEAQTLATKIIDDLNIKDVALVNAEKAVLIAFDNTYDNQSIISDKMDTGGYIFEYVRSAGGIPGYFLNGYFGASEPDYAPPFYIETITIIVTDNGVEYFVWDSISEKVGTVNENVALLPFEDIKTRIIDQIIFKRTPALNSTDIQSIDIDIIDAKLRVSNIGVAGDVDQALIVPVWAFDTKETMKYKNGEETTMYLSHMLNAIDGGEIGY
jgi:hypothetical protein